jgi:GNAT superfamily N-acetyltransferase
MTTGYDEYEISDDRQRLDFDRVHAWLASTYWSPGIPREKVERAADNSSMVVAAYHGTDQVAYMRVISDRTTFAYLADVFVDSAHRRRGIASAMVRFALAHPEYQGLRNWMLLTADAHDVYRQCGFEVYPNPERVMNFRPGSS